MEENTEPKKEHTPKVHVSDVNGPQVKHERGTMVDTKADAERTAMERIETAADELFRLRAQSAYVNERVRNLAAILHLATVVIGPNAERSELVRHSLTGAKRICDGLIAATH
jgi:hypothetical protein